MIPYWEYNVKIYNVSSKWKFVLKDINRQGYLKGFFRYNKIIK